MLLRKRDSGLAIGCALALAVPSIAAASSGGIQGYSGKSGATVICNQCHSGGNLPGVTITGPTQLAPSAIGTFRITVTSPRPAQTGAGFNVASSAGTLNVITSNDSRKSGNELTHTTTKVNSGGEAFWDFTWQAPAAPGTYTIFGAGNSVNRNELQTGDRSAARTLSVEVLAASSPTPTPSSTQTPTQTDTPAVTATPTTTPTPAACPGDCDGDGALTQADLARIRASMLLCGPCTSGAPGGPAPGCDVAPEGCIAADLDEDGCLEAAELTLFVSATLGGGACP